MKHPLPVTILSGLLAAILATAEPDPAPSSAVDAPPIAGQRGSRLQASLLHASGLRDSGQAAAYPVASSGGRLRVKFNGQVAPYPVLAVFVLPGESLTLEAISEPSSTIVLNREGEDLNPGLGQVSVNLRTPAGGPAVFLAHNSWRWDAPEAQGLYPLRFSAAGFDSTLLNVFVMVPFERARDDRLGDYPIGQYPADPLNDNPIYERPRGFVELTPENEETFVTPHFQLKQFACKQAGGHPKYLVLREDLLLRLESILAMLNTRGFDLSTLHIMSGYRTPFYNQAIGNVRYSCHQWGIAADIFVDGNGDEVMDDLNRDGRTDAEDAGFLYDLIDELSTLGGSQEALHGGLARYAATEAHGPFVHVDVRGHRARWGT